MDPPKTAGGKKHTHRHIHTQRTLTEPNFLIRKIPWCQEGIQKPQRLWVKMYQLIQGQYLGKGVYLCQVGTELVGRFMSSPLGISLKILYLASFWADNNVLLLLSGLFVVQAKQPPQKKNNSTCFRLQNLNLKTDPKTLGLCDRNFLIIHAAASSSRSNWTKPWGGKNSGVSNHMSQIKFT